MTRIFTIAASAAVALVLGTVVASQAIAERIDWADLVDESKQTYEDPFKDLSYDQLSDLVDVVRLREKLANDDLPEDGRTVLQARLDKANASLEAAEIDAEWLISQRWIVADRRKAAAISGNPEIDGKQISLAGFAIPAPPDPDGASVVYLVPERGMCSHMPPPNPNQMLRVRLQSGWVPSVLHQPVLLTGQLDLDFSEHSVMVVDGFVPMRASFALEATQVVTVADLQKDQSGTSTWVDGLSDSTLPSVHGQSTGTQ